ncbi:pentapeptide repeat-containing protein [Campylobacter lari]|uniref:pentapeptide repeat-containing protein n=1 Tax=Campylobacter lari TaxID=201 RepID=UPI001F092CE5|nr:pentapeptide repeat-containing protein [Campylobacter lari]MCH3694476.1 pentapeptide repeat-containing protein [Campylobacter lari]MCH3696025.1 pentapeptide repeat-containing protein [Campylobacter lari]
MEEFDKEKAIEDIAKKLNVEKNKILYIEYSDFFQINDCIISIVADDIKIFQEYNLYFYRCTIPNLILEITIKSLEFKMCCFESSFAIRNNFDGYISIEDSIFEKDFGIFWVKKEIYKINICKNIFKDVSIFENKILNFNFEENSIQNISMCNNLFKKEARFNSNNFNYKCIFFKNLFENLSFYGANFEESFIFFQNTIKGNLNATNTNLNFTFDNLQDKIKQEYENFNKDIKEKENKKSLDKFANDFRDSFRVFKNALIKDNNLLEASNFHKYELYCKEIELNSNDILSKYERDEVFDKLSLRLKQKVDWCLLLFYRKLSDHHTDLLKVINNCFILIAVYFICIFNFTNVDFLEIKEINLFSFLKSFSFYGDDKIVAAAKVVPLSCLLLLFFSPVVIFIASLYYSDKQKRSVIFKKIKFKVGKFLLIVTIFAVMQLMLFVINFGLFVPLIKIVVFLSIFFLVICIDSLYLRYYCVILSYINFIIVIVYYPIVLNPLIGKVLNDKIKIEDPLVMVMTFTYTILMFLVLFSLQKTARKNSIVPS